MPTYALGVLDDLDQLSILRPEVSRADYESLLRSERSITFFRDCDRAWRILYVNILEQKKGMERLREHVIEPRLRLRRLDYEITHRELNRTLFNVLSAFYGFLEFTETSFSRYFGAGSVECAHLAALKSGYFDNHFEYRFFYKLRNFTVHCGLPIQLVQGVPMENGESALAVLFHPEQMLKEFEWGRILKPELEEYGPAPIPVFTTLIAFHNLVGSFAEEVMKFVAKHSLGDAEEHIRILDGRCARSHTIAVLEEPRFEEERVVDARNFVLLETGSVASILEYCRDPEQQRDEA